MAGYTGIGELAMALGSLNGSRRIETLFSIGMFCPRSAGTAAVVSALGGRLP